MIRDAYNTCDMCVHNGKFLSSRSFLVTFHVVFFLFPYTNVHSIHVLSTPNFFKLINLHLAWYQIEYEIFITYGLKSQF